MRFAGFLLASSLGYWRANAHVYGSSAGCTTAVVPSGVQDFATSTLQVLTTVADTVYSTQTVFATVTQAGTAPSQSMCTTALPTCETTSTIATATSDLGPILPSGGEVDSAGYNAGANFTPMAAKQDTYASNGTLGGAFLYYPRGNRHKHNHQHHGRSRSDTSEDYPWDDDYFFRRYGRRRYHHHRH